MKRYVISPVIGDGQTFGTVYRSAASDVIGAGFVDLIKGHPETGHPVWFFAFSRIGMLDSFAPVANVSNSFVFPEFPLDAQMSLMDSATRTAMVQNVQSYNLDNAGTHIDATHADTDSYRTVIEKIARNWQAVFIADNFDCAEGR